ncbi:hypothetical protein GCM10010413_31350 [Promicromonospora sukumoe]|uniref:DUF998 domain-containing protein n=1 Tax=Promicromonospora sukumoe TaxID=88382 RepID=A0A7W3J7U1_9MICO|nr:DUF998 domain-containing protein [Promicromonospora sukumoe]MBA8807888.1 hypothetical protein [Promicromonospora sukumoe]
MRPAETSRALTRLAAVLAFLGPVAFLVAEAVSAVAWTAGAYDYGVNFISDLGTTVCGAEYGGRVMCSPLHAVMNAGFVTMGLSMGGLFTVLALRRRGAVGVLVAVAGWSVTLDMFLVALFPGGAESVGDGTIALHVLGAAVAILFANALFVVVGAGARRFGLPAWSAATVVLGVVGLVGLVLTLAPQELAEPAVFERVAVYSIFAACGVTGAALLAASRRSLGEARPTR